MLTDFQNGYKTIYNITTTPQYVAALPQENVILELRYCRCHRTVRKHSF